MHFDSSGTLLVTRVEEMPTTLWIWDVGDIALRAVMIFHAAIAQATWHPSIGELLLVRCEGDESKGLIHFWDPSWEIPKIIDLASQLPCGKAIGKTVVRWLGTDGTAPAIFFSDSQDYILASISELDEGELPWHDAEARAFDIYGQQEESPLNFAAADSKRGHGKVTVAALMEQDDLTGMGSGNGGVEDTFQFRRGVNLLGKPSTAEKA
jgi:hypothetical protein